MTKADQDWVDPKARTVPATEDQQEMPLFAVVMAKPFDWKWMPASQNVWNNWICQSRKSTILEIMYFLENPKG